MRIFYYSNHLKKYLDLIRKNHTIGFVPTMGALHNGHLSLMAESQKKCDVTVASIFVNPKQFNNLEDFQKYPKVVETDLELLHKNNIDLVFIPSFEDIYPTYFQDIQLNIYNNARVCEGQYRPGHFQGVINVVHQLFQIVEPHSVFFGKKDLQQCMIIELLIQKYFPNITQYNVDTLREKNGLAMSSRNMRLSEEGKNIAGNIYIQLNHLQKDLTAFHYNKYKTIQQLELLNITTEYLELVSLPDFHLLNSVSLPNRTAIVYAGYLEKIRLIDNITILNNENKKVI